MYYIKTVVLKQLVNTVIGIQLKQRLIENNNVFYPISPKSKIHLKLNFRKFKH